MLTYFKVLKTKIYNSAGWVDFANAEKDIAEKYSLVQFSLGTGKKHQIRLACAYALKMPIVGDFKYTYDSQNMSNDLLRRSLKYTKYQERDLFKDSILLHSSELTIPAEPDSTKMKTFKSDPGKEGSWAVAFCKVLN